MCYDMGAYVCDCSFSWMAVLRLWYSSRIEGKKTMQTQVELSDKCLAALDEETTYICLICPLCYQNKCKLSTENKRQRAELKEGNYAE